MGRVSFALGVISWLCSVASVSGIGANWGTQTSHTLSPTMVVQMLRENGFDQVKLFDAEEQVMGALRKSGLQVMVGIPNDMLAMLATSMKAANNWVSTNVSAYLNDGVDIRYVAVGNEPFLQTYNGSFLQTTYPALQNIQGALIKAGLSRQVKVTIPLNADVYSSPTSRPSDGDFRSDIRDLMLAIVKFLYDNGAPFTVNIYPFISLYSDPNFPMDYAFFEGSSSGVVDGSVTYTNMFDANLDTLIWALKKNGYPTLPVIVGEIGWPTDGDMNANVQLAQKFNQGFMNRVSTGKGTPMRSDKIEAYLFSLIDEDEKSIQPGNFERHWGIYTYDGWPKYQLNLGTTKTGAMVRVKNVQYQDKQWCVLKPSVNLDNSKLAATISYACANADCTSLGYRTSCGDLDTRGNISYAFNSYYQKNDQDEVACGFENLATLTNKDPSMGTCRFGVMIIADSGISWRIRHWGASCVLFVVLPVFLNFLL